MNQLWRWFFRFVVTIGLLCAAFMMLLVFGMSRPSVSQSDGFIDRTSDAIDCTISHQLPESAEQIRYLRASVGLGGRLRIYRFTAPVADLHQHAIAEFDAHWHRPGYLAKPNAASPFEPRDVKLIADFCGASAEWLLPPANASGTIYEPADGESSHRPIIFVDEINSVLYFRMTD
ncbi:MAG: hypothetical protein WBD20_16200 [Pirellulaceae bacterium]